MPPENRFERPQRSPDTQAKISLQREQKQIIRGILNDGKGIIEEGWRNARGEFKQTFTLTTEDLTRGGLLPRDDVANLIRGWIFDTYGGKLGLYYYDEKKHAVTFSFSPEEFPPSEE